jgi:hypothetical protein
MLDFRGVTRRPGRVKPEVVGVSSFGFPSLHVKLKS